MKTVLNIEGMVCGHCAKYVTEVLEELNGVESATVSFENKNAVIEHDDELSVLDMKSAVEEAGYEVVSY
ncbi:MAG: heavy-metal-associated domain-containing protein [Deferribacteraceae bacterium]|nr:heavy-metal-associated domain-containing protein [Deferribacteraceae bacterium]